MEIKINEVEVSKLNLQPGEILLVRCVGPDFDEYYISMIRESFQKLLPNNKVAIYGSADNSYLDLTIVKPEDFTNLDSQNSEDKVSLGNASDCSQPTSYCNDCHCGKKEMIEGAKK